MVNRISPAAIAENRDGCICDHVLQGMVATVPVLGAMAAARGTVYVPGQSSNGLVPISASAAHPVAAMCGRRK